MTYSVQDLQGRIPPLNNTQGLSNVGQRVRGFEQLISFVRRANNRTQPRFAFRDDRITDGGREDSCLKQLLRKFKRIGRLAHVDRNNRRFADLELESALLQFALEELRVSPKLFHQLL